MADTIVTSTASESLGDSPETKLGDAVADAQCEQSEIKTLLFSADLALQDMLKHPRKEVASHVMMLFYMITERSDIIGKRLDDATILLTTQKFN